MKYLKSLSALILVASVLLLSASGSGASPSNQPHTNQIEQTSSANHATAAPTAAVSNQHSAIPTSTQSASYTYNYYYPSPETWLTFFGQIAAIVTAVLLTAFTGGIWWTSIKQWGTLAKQVEIAKESAEAAKNSAESYRKSLAMQARPKLRIRQVHLVQKRPLLAVDYVMVNIGGSPLHIVTSLVALRKLDQPPGLALYVQSVDVNSNTIGHITLQAGERRRVRAHCNEGIDANELGVPSLYFFGLITYKDDFGIHRETAFCRRYRFDDLFEWITNLDREYED
jgi:hypothetical protein